MLKIISLIDFESVQNILIKHSTYNQTLKNYKQIIIEQP